MNRCCSTIGSHIERRLAGRSLVCRNSRRGGESSAACRAWGNDRADRGFPRPVARCAPWGGFAPRKESGKRRRERRAPLGTCRYPPLAAPGMRVSPTGSKPRSRRESIHHRRIFRARSLCRPRHDRQAPFGIAQPIAEPGKRQHRIGPKQPYADSWRSPTKVSDCQSTEWKRPITILSGPRPLRATSARRSWVAAPDSKRRFIFPLSDRRVHGSRWHSAARDPFAGRIRSAGRPWRRGRIARQMSWSH